MSEDTIEFLKQALAHECAEAGSRCDFAAARRLALMRGFVESVVKDRTTNGWINADEAEVLRRKVKAAERLANAIRNYDNYAADPDFRSALEEWDAT